MHRAAVLASFATLLGLASPAQAANILTNGNFETGNLTGWSLVGNSFVNFVDNGNPYEGTYSFLAQQFGSIATISQTVATLASTSYQLSFRLFNNLGPTEVGGNEWYVQWNGSDVAHVTNTASFPYTLQSFNVTGTGSDTLTFGFRHDPGGFRLDAVELDGVAVAEPGALALLCIGLLGVTVLRRRGAPSAQPCTA